MMLLDDSMTMMMNASPEGIAAVVVVGLTLLYFIWSRIRRHLQAKKPFGDELPMPSGSHWFFGHLTMFGNDFTKVHQKVCYDEADDHGVCSFWLTNYKGVTVTRHEDARAVLQSTAEHTVVPLMRKHFNKFLGKRNIGTMNGKEWKYHRSAILRVFHSQSTLVSSRKAMVDVTQTLVDSLQNQPQPVEMDIEPVMKMITMDVFGLTALSYDFGCCKNLEASPFAVAFSFLGKDFLRRLRSPFVPTNSFYGIPTATNQRHARENALIRDFLQDLIESRRQEKAQHRSPDLLTSLLKAHDELQEQAVEVMTDEIIVDNMMALLFAGFDTTSITLMYALYLVATNPAVEQECLNEIDGIWKQDGSLANPDRLVYCGGVISETLRLYPPAFVVNRKATKAIELSNGFVLPEGTMVLIPIFMIQHDPQHFERPEECLVERWIKQDGAGGWTVRDENDTSYSDIPPGNRNAIFAFSGGARSCAAQKFAIQEATLVLANLLKNLKFTVKPGYVPYPQRSGIVQSPREGMPMTITTRE